MTFRLWSKNSRNISEMLPIWGPDGSENLSKVGWFSDERSGCFVQEHLSTWVLINNETKIQWTVEFVQLESNFQNKLTS